MSSIASTRDGMQELRKKSLIQERKIDRDGEFAHWHLSDATKVSLVERALGVLALPIFFFWCLLVLVLSLGMSVSLICFKILSGIFR